MTVGQFIDQATNKLDKAGITTARLDCLILLEDTLRIDRARILAHPETKIPIKTEVELNTKVIQRAAHRPLAYIRNQADFYGRTFTVNAHTLVPRPESEAIIDILKRCDLPKHATIADIGTGSGCLGITAALELPGSEVILSDVDKNALEIARQNSQAHLVKTSVLESNLLTNINSRLNVVLANLPYVPDSYPINQAAAHEPKLALYAGKDGLDLYRQLWQQISALADRPQFIITESLPSQHPGLEELAKKARYYLSVSDGLIQCFQPTLSAQHQA